MSTLVISTIGIFTAIAVMRTATAVVTATLIRKIGGY